MSGLFDEFSDLRLEDARALLAGAEAALERALERARALTERRQADRRPPGARPSASPTPPPRAAPPAALRRARGAHRGAKAAATRALELGAVAGTALLVASLRARLAPAAGRARPRRRDARGAPSPPRSARGCARRAARPCCARSAATDRGARGRNDLPLDETLEQVRDSVREFAERGGRARTPSASTATTSWCPRRSSAKMAELGYFGLSVPEAVRRLTRWATSR